MRVRLAACLWIGALVASVPGARAEGINLYWNDCSPARGGAGVTGLANDCTSNTGSLSLVASFVPPAGVTALLAAEGTINLTLAGSSVPSWWQMQSAGCRSTSISAAFQFAGRSACAKPWSASALGFFSYAVSPPCCPDPRMAQIKVAVAVPPADTVATSTALEYYAFEILIDREKSIGAGSCEGCAAAACIELRAIGLYQPSGLITFGNLVRTEQNRFVTYNGAQVGDCAFTPVRNRTWGALKAMYR
jgi:hypothetical protein